MVPPDHLIGNYPVFLEPAPDGLQDHLGGLPLIADYKNKDAL